MPAYQNTFPPTALAPGDTGFSFNAENPAPPQAGAQFALAPVYGFEPRSLGVEIRYGSAPTAVQVDIQTAIDDVDANYVTAYSSTNTAGEHVNVVNLKGRFARAKKVSQTGGGALTVEFVG